MKHKILISGRNQVMVSDFFQHTETFFDTLSTSTIRSDIAGHFRYFKPEAYIAFIDSNPDQAIQQLKELKNSDFYNGAAIAVIGDSDICNTLERRERGLADMVIRRPVTSDNLALRITRHLEDVHETQTMTAHVEKMEQMDALIKAAEAAVSEASATAATAQASAVRKHILVVDDDRTVLKMLKTALDGDYDVTTMASGSLVDRILDAKKVDMIILDYEMPVETGADVFRRIKKKPLAANIPVCFLTGVSDREKIMEVMALKPHGYILKPIDMDMLSATIKNLIG